MEKSDIYQNTTPRMKAMFDFLNDLANHNNREWFQAHKAEYESLRTVFEFMVQELITEISKFDEAVRHVQAKECIFRIYRDTRFSTDKTPYKTHFGAWITRGGRKSEYPGYYLHIEPGNSLLAAGIWHPDPKLIKMVRQEVLVNYDELAPVLHDTDFEKRFGSVQGSSLRTIPRGFPKDFAEPYLLMLKDFFVEHGVKDCFFDEHWISRAGKILHIAYPFNQFLVPVIDEYLGVI